MKGDSHGYLVPMRITFCDELHPCFIILYSFAGVSALSSGIVFIVHGPSNPAQPVLFGVFICTLFVTFMAHAWSKKKRRLSNHATNVLEPSNV